jgi:hypothetical protein
MFLFNTLDYVDGAGSRLCMVVEKPLKTAACARYFVEACYELLSMIEEASQKEGKIQTRILMIESLLVRVEDQIAEKGLKLFVDTYDEKITTHISNLNKLDYLGDSPEVLRVTRMCLINLKHNFECFAEEAELYLPRSMLKEYIVKRKLSEYLRLLTF